MIFDNLKSVLGRIESAAARSGRTASEVQLVAVTKKAGPEAVAGLLKTGLVSQIGENQVQDAERKAKALQSLPDIPRPTWRMIGHLQTNKASVALEAFDTIDSLDSLRLAQALEARLARMGKKLPVLVQVKLTDRETQSGVSLNELEGFLIACRRYGRLELRGLMAIAPMLEPVEAVRPHFKRLRQSFDRFFRDGGTLSMGMSRDFEIAVEEGSTMVRIGTALFV